MQSIKSKGSNFTDLSKATDEFFKVATGKPLDKIESEPDSNDDRLSSLSERSDDIDEKKEGMKSSDGPDLDMLSCDSDDDDDDSAKAVKPSIKSNSKNTNGSIEAIADN